MRDSLRAEFPALARARLPRWPSVAREPIGWSFLSGVGAGFIVGGLVSVLLLPLYPLLFPLTEPRPEWLTPAAISRAAAGIATGAVLVRAGGPAALGAYVLFELALLVAADPSRQVICAHIPPAGQLDRGFDIPCDLPTTLLHQWPMWMALALGAALSRILVSASGAGTSWMLRGGGIYTVVTSIVGTVVELVFTGSSLDLQTTLGLFTSGVFVASALAGVALARSSRTAAVLLAVLIVAPAMAFSLPLALRNAVGPEPFEMTLARWAGVLVPLLGALTLIAFAEYVRRKLREPSPTAVV